MIDPVDTFHQLIKKRPDLLNSPPSMRSWVGSVTQQYGTVAHELRDLRAEHDYLKEKLNLEKAIKDIVSTDLSNHDKLNAIEDILEG